MMFVLIGLLGCDPIGTVEGIVVDDQGRPVGGAQVTVTCAPGDSGDGSGRTDGGGMFKQMEIPDISASCQFEISKPGYDTITVPRSSLLYNRPQSQPVSAIRVVVLHKTAAAPVPP